MGYNEEIFVVDLKKGEVSKGKYEGRKPGATFSFTDEDFFKIATGKMNPQIAFMRGKMKVKGSLSAAQKFTPDILGCTETPPRCRMTFPKRGETRGNAGETSPRKGETFL
ncbi:SCP2 sterol-binding domain-containing protein, partial [Tanacetum coccineum]